MQPRTTISYNNRLYSHRLRKRKGFNCFNWIRECNGSGQKSNSLTPQKLLEEAEKLSQSFTKRIFKVIILIIIGGGRPLQLIEGGPTFFKCFLKAVRHLLIKSIKKKLRFRPTVFKKNLSWKKE